MGMVFGCSCFSPADLVYAFPYRVLLGIRVQDKFRSIVMMVDLMMVL